MAKEKIELFREYYPLDKAAELAGCQVDDLLHLAASRKIHICVIAEAWIASRVYERDNSIDVAGQELPVSYRAPVSMGQVEALADNDQPKPVQQGQPSETKDVMVGNIIQYARRGPFSTFYDYPTTGVEPVAAFCFAIHLHAPTKAKIELDLNHMLGSPDVVHERFIRPVMDVLVGDALRDGKLVLKADELSRFMCPDQGNPDDAKPDGAVSRKSLLKLIIGMAVDGYGYDPAAKRSPLPKDLERDLNLLDIGLTDDTIRDALKEAAAYLPRKPPKS